MKEEKRLSRLKEMMKNAKTSTTIALWSFSVVAVALLIASFIVPPTGQIDPSVLKAGSLLFAFAALFEIREAITEGLGVKLTHGDTTVVVHDMDGHGPDDHEHHAPFPHYGMEQDVEPEIPVDNED